MTNLEFIEKVALFYYFSFLDETKAHSAAATTIKKIRMESVGKKRSKSNISHSDFVRVTDEYMRKSSRDVKATSLAFTVDHIILPEKSNWGPWFEFRKVANEKDFRALLYSKVLNVTEEDLAVGLRLPLGTVRYRLGRALKLWVEFVMPVVLMLNSDADPSSDRLPRASRKLSHFIAQELLSDYMHGELDADRKEALEEYLRIHPELQYELRAMQEAESYARELSKTQISPVYLEELNHIKPATELFLNKVRWRNWPDLMRWSTEALVVSMAVAIVAMMVPWDKLNLKFPQRGPEVTLAEINEPDSEPPQQAATQLNVDEQDHVDVTKPVDLKNQSTAEVADQSTKIEAPAGISMATEKKNLVVHAAPTAPTVQAQEKATAEAMDDELPTEGVASEKTTKAQNGLLYRVMMNQENSEEVSVTLRKKIIELGGKKAGQVELGWRKNDPNGNYFHFSLPEEQYQKLITTLGTYGPVRIYKNPHQRVMPEGQIRIILWIEDKTPATQDQ